MSLIPPSAKSRFFQIDFQMFGVRHCYSSRTENETEALEIERSHKERLRAAGAAPPMAAEGAKDCTFNQAAYMYWQTDAQFARKSKQIKGMMKRLVLQVGPDEMCSDLGYDEFKRVRTELRTCNRGRPTKRKGKYAPKTINNYLELMLTILREAERKLTTSFARRPTRKEMVKLKEKVVQRSRHFSEAEEKKMEAFSDPDLKDMWKFDLLTGIRADELCGVRWDKINWSRNRVSVEVKATGMDPYWREIECIPEAMKILYRRKRLGYHDEFVFTLPLDRDGWLDEKRRRRGDQILVSSRLFYTRMCAIWKKASIPDAIVHDLRRTAGRRIYDEHKDIEAARVFLGHGDWRETARYLGLKPRDVVPTARRASARSTANLAEIDAAMGEVPRQPVPTSNAARSAALRIVGQEIAAQINAGRN